MATNHDGHAVVLGGSMAGLLASRVLAERYRTVTVLDRDDLTRPDGGRRGVPQGAHAHVLLARGGQVLEELFPGLTRELVDQDVPYGDPLAQARMHLSGHRLCRTSTGVAMLSLSRPFLEHHVRERVRALPNVTFAPPCDIVDLSTTPDAGRVTGVRVVDRGEDARSRTVGADLVVDATGRGSRTPRWLAGLGYEPPAEEKAGIAVGYATCYYRLPDDALDGDWGTLHAPTPDLPRGGALNRIERGRWLLTLLGLGGDHPPTDPGGYVAFAKSLRFPDIHDAICSAEAIEGPLPYRFPANVRRRYERLARFPDGLLVLGDAVCSFNPIYGQGMTVAALEALALRDHLAAHPEPRARRFLRDLASLVDDPWQMAIGGDLMFPGAKGRRTGTIKVAGAYLPRLHAAATHDAALAAGFVRVSGMVDPPGTLLRPGVALRVLRHTLAGRRNRRRSDIPSW